jgi:hypothetical protein
MLTATTQLKEMSKEPLRMIAWEIFKGNRERWDVFGAQDGKELDTREDECPFHL